MQASRHAAGRGERHQCQSKDGDADAKRFGKSGCNTSAREGETQNPEKPTTKRVREGEFETAADEVDVVLSHDDAKRRRMITLIENTGENPLNVQRRVNLFALND